MQTVRSLAIVPAIPCLATAQRRWLPIDLYGPPLVAQRERARPPIETVELTHMAGVHQANSAEDHAAVATARLMLGVNQVYADLNMVIVTSLIGRWPATCGKQSVTISAVVPKPVCVWIAISLTD
jgi:hypothetical protein